MRGHRMALGAPRGDRAAFYAALAMLTSVGVFLFTRTLIPEVDPHPLPPPGSLQLPHRHGGPQTGALLPRLCRRSRSLFWPKDSSHLSSSSPPPFPTCILTGEWRRWRQFHLFTGLLLFLAIAAPWHILAGLAIPTRAIPSATSPPPETSTASSTSISSTNISSASSGCATPTTTTGSPGTSTGCPPHLPRPVELCTGLRSPPRLADPPATGSPHLHHHADQHHRLS